jgi:hypothetical protein
MKAKFFQSNDIGHAGEALNEWLEASGCDVVHVVQSQSEKQGRFVFVVTVFYREKY